MSIEQTSQLLQLMLNGLLLSLLCGVMVVIASVRSRFIWMQLHPKPFASNSMARGEGMDWPRWSRQRRSLRRVYRIERSGQSAAYLALGIAILSELIMAMRSLVNWNGLIEISLVCFVASLGLLWVSVLCVLVSEYSGDRWVRDAEIHVELPSQRLGADLPIENHRLRRADQKQ